ncbi:alkaline phosphatase family protein [Actinoplanes sp. NPDC051411]|uniref:alkaline phosphatase family protein n=1 Tax=Actinoplanes sp. NPDC051411 TaxID=3155522 RepID=UPI003414FC1D
MACIAWDVVRCAILSVLRFIRQGRGRDEPSRPPIDHVFVLMLENRSFDHMFGFSGLRGVGIDGEPTSVIGAVPARDTNVDPVTGAVVPVSTPADFALKNIDTDPDHEFAGTLVALAGEGAAYGPTPGGYPAITNSGFVANYRDGGSATPERIMHCYTPDQLPVLHRLAEEFAICDRWFSSMPGPTWPNRFFLLASSSGGLDDSPTPLEVVDATTVDGYRFANGSLFGLLDEYCIPWKIFEGDEFPVSFAMNGMNLNALQGRFTDFDEFRSEVNGDGFASRFVFIEPKYGAHDFDVTGPGDFTCGNSMHPLDDVTRGERLVKSVYESIRSSPLWERSMLLVLFDEHGGFYDHVAPPPAVPPGDTITQSYVKNGFLFDQLGVRVPALVISPYVRRGTIDHTDYDHTSMPATVERLFGMTSLTERDKAANDVLHLLSLGTPRQDTPHQLPEPAVNPDPLSCDDESEDALIVRRSELRTAQRDRVFRERRTDTMPMTPSQIGFAHIALIRVLQTAEYPERQKWIEQYAAMTNAVDAALLMTEATLKLRHGIDFKRFERLDNPDGPLQRRLRPR